ncbi:GNAT family N-acetyltransferase [Pseudosulfitobacter sp. DSM 107133]|uniref:GNAT family N-acetyltransferase n=1 Tax=Pseudosulfitobacter sp. DSM 107133 TaxID=2883100 RepID=UPI000DF15E74|nr:GNAT family N-acetyltransferase [Pseudosulfitobacter sp. DSM 107133]UOA27927.1 dTDP-fucosamine acetyltransferase [Pseudosulfitobacter sp. DSM 107133]
MTDFQIRAYTPDDAAWVHTAHARHYRDVDGFDDSFGVLVASILRDFDAGHDPARAAGWIAMDDRGAPAGCIFCMALNDETAKLRMFLVTQAARGSGVGFRLLQTCMDFARDKGYTGMALWTHESHKAACALYRRNGWQLVHCKPVRAFGQDLVEQEWKIRF